MSQLVELTKDNEIAVVTIDNSPVNALSPGVPEGIDAAIAQINSDPAIRAAILIGSGRTFIAGADIKEFGKITSGQKKRDVGLLPILLNIEDCTKPVVAAIHGTALGGGLEVAMACHYRVAVATAQVGQPEVKLGIIPGAAGTQRLPRLAGVAKAVEMCVTGDPVNAADALAAGILDQIVNGDLLSGALAFARQIAAKPAPKTRERNKKLRDSSANSQIFAAARELAAKKYRGMMAPLKAIEAIEAATQLPFAEGCAAEAKLFMECLFSDQSKALIHVFFGEREVAKIPDVPKDTPVIPVTSAAIVGAGTMGSGIAMVFANAGIPVVLKEVDRAALDRGLTNIRKNYTNSVKRGRFTQEFVDRRLALISPTLSYDDLKSAGMIVEAVFEGMELKKKVFSELDRIAKAGALLASNTSTLNIDEIASATSRPHLVIGTHFFSPVNVMRLLEIVRGQSTGKEAIATCMQLAKKLGKVGVLVGNCRGFVGNRMFGPYRREAQFLVEEGAPIEAVDKALYDFGMAMGPLATGDLAGLDVGWRIRKEFQHLEKPGIRQPIAEDRLCELGRYGQKTGSGWYKYDENRRAIPDPEVAEMVRKWSAEAGIPQRTIGSAEIVDRTIYALVNEGARILEEGMALRSVDIDIIYVNGYGFPSWRGGPMFYADTVGLQNVYERILEFERQHGEIWTPAPLLKKLARQGQTFTHYSSEKSTVA
ncbi:MAG TPA: 3-hydroxyacyl-CoA dehydrogenase NAD-binding domain-containing protein [Bryobacteraceae bacterium]|nr:3-hydroxyacyl-CoA dehydrogenase NAD-binding domain-containing protein [Bryobacteraceae bacterium]